MVKNSYRHWAAVLVLTLGAGCAAHAGNRDMQQDGVAWSEDTADAPEDFDSSALPGAKLIRDVAYGSDKKQRFDVYLPPHPDHAPLLVMVHGGAWRFGDKGARGVVRNKARHWLPQGFIFVSVNNRLLPDAAPLQQADDVAAALMAIRRLAPQWGGDPGRLILMGHSAGAHLVALLAADPARAGLLPWSGTVVLDSAAFDLVALMLRPHHRFYDKVFGKDGPATWAAASPQARLNRNATPQLVVCSTQRKDGSCAMAQSYANKGAQVGARIGILPEDMSHAAINKELGEPSAYTNAVDGFIGQVLGEAGR